MIMSYVSISGSTLYVKQVPRHKCLFMCSIFLDNAENSICSRQNVKPFSFRSTLSPGSSDVQYSSMITKVIFMFCRCPILFCEDYYDIHLLYVIKLIFGIIRNSNRSEFLENPFESLLLWGLRVDVRPFFPCHVLLSSVTYVVSQK